MLLIDLQHFYLTASLGRSDFLLQKESVVILSLVGIYRELKKEEDMLSPEIMEKSLRLFIHSEEIRKNNNCPSLFSFYGNIEKYIQ